MRTERDTAAPPPTRGPLNIHYMAEDGIVGIGALDEAGAEVPEGFTPPVSEPVAGAMLVYAPDGARVCGVLVFAAIGLAAWLAHPLRAFLSAEMLACADAWMQTAADAAAHPDEFAHECAWCGGRTAHDGRPFGDGVNTFAPGKPACAACCAFVVPFETYRAAPAAQC